ncbi:hypothetical protein CSAL01_09357 [Colletotrichum salicis]|uniref:Uncharacterized protein n=1 Tax=Colletotrichum salicis TaxID=1209931 RepID=A0A135V611_9PEZI|nr:hypothetical protein CSAL01_09357 [Colletotrichum salicis]
MASRPLKRQSRGKDDDGLPPTTQRRTKKTKIDAGEESEKGYVRALELLLGMIVNTIDDVDEWLTAALEGEDRRPNFGLRGLSLLISSNTDVTDTVGSLSSRQKGWIWKTVWALTNGPFTYIPLLKDYGLCPQPPPSTSIRSNNRQILTLRSNRTVALLTCIPTDTLADSWRTSKTSKKIERLLSVDEPADSLEDGEAFKKFESGIKEAIKLVAKVSADQISTVDNGLDMITPTYTNVSQTDYSPAGTITLAKQDVDSTLSLYSF